MFVISYMTHFSAKRGYNVGTDLEDNFSVNTEIKSGETTILIVLKISTF